MKNKLIKVFIWLWLSIVIVGAFLYAPLDPRLKEFTRALYFHVPMAWIAVLAFLLSAIYSAMYLKRRTLKYDYYAEAASQLGFLFTVLATVTGAIWAKNTWGTYWNWDPRQTSIFILLLIYAAYFALRSAIEQHDRRAALSAVYAILAFVTVPFFVFIVPRIYFSLHPSETIVDQQGGMGMGPKQLTVFLSSMFGYTMLFVWILRMKMDVIKLKLRINELEK